MWTKNTTAEEDLKVLSRTFEVFSLIQRAFTSARKANTSSSSLCLSASLPMDGGGGNLSSVNLFHLDETQSVSVGNNIIFNELASTVGSNSRGGEKEEIIDSVA